MALRQRPCGQRSLKMPACNKLATITFIAVAMLAPLGKAAQAAQCGSGPGGFEAWKAEFAREASAKGVGATATSALMQTSYASATINADRSQRSFGLSLDQFLAKRGASTIVARGPTLKQPARGRFGTLKTPH